jgi:selenocysteine-specific elongation factor
VAVRSIVIGTAGHIDHGKSALVRALTGTDPDRLKEERERGITIDLGFAHAHVGGINLAFVDVPGHERFVKNMLAGAGGLDLVMLVVAADESVMPQTREHFDICRLLRIPAGVIALTKIDVADAETIALATLETRELVRESFLESAPIVAVSARTGEGLERLRDALVTAAGEVPGRNSDGPARMPIDRVFSMKGFGTIVTGTLVSGQIHEDQELIVLRRNSDGRRAKVRGLQVHGRPEAFADAGRRVAVNLGGVEAAEIVRGDTLCAPGAFEPTRALDVRVELLPDAPPLRQGARVRFHQGTTELFGRVSMVSTSAKDYARLRLESAAVVTRGDRFVIRAYSPLSTIGGGVVLDPQPPRVALRTPEGLARFTRIDVHDSVPDTALLAFVEDREEAGLEVGALIRRGGLTERAAGEAVERLLRTGAVVRIGDLLISSRALGVCTERLLAGLTAHHTANPLSDGLPREEARKRVFRRAPPAVFDAVLEGLVTSGKIVARDRLALAGRQVSLSPEEVRVQEVLDRMFKDARLAPPDTSTAAEAAKAPRAVIDRVMVLLVRNRRLVKLDSLVFHASALEFLKDDVRAMKAADTNVRVDVTAFKERYGVTRKYAIPLLEYLDRERVTRRVGDARVVL